MTDPMAPGTQVKSSFAGDIWGGLAAMLVALPSSIAFGVLIFSPLGPEYAGKGAMTGILGAAAIGIITPTFGRTGGLISAPCAPAAAVLSAVVADLLSGKAGSGIGPEAIPGIIAMTVLLSALFQIFYGTLGLGRLIKFIPYPVVSGYLSGVGIIIALGQLPKLFGIPKDISLTHGLLTPGMWKIPGLIVGIIAMVIMASATKFTKKIPAPVLGLSGGIVTYFFLGYFLPELMELKGNSLIVGPIQASGSFFEAVSGRASSLISIDFSTIKLVFIPAVTLSVLLSIDTLKTCVVLDALTKSRHNSDRELIGQGVGNLAAFFSGGMPGAGTMGPTLVNVTSGGRTHRSGVMEGVFVVLALLLLSNLIAWVPIGALAGILLVIAWRMFDKNILHLLASPAGRQDFAVILAVILVAVAVGLIAASGVGIGLAILLFIRDQIRGSVIRRKMYLNQVSSKTRRMPAAREILNKNGDQAVFCELQGNLFFGTTDQLFSQLEPELRTKRFILLDMRRVLSMDYTAAHLLENMESQLEERGGKLLFSGMPSALIDRRNFENYLGQLGIIQKKGGVMVSETLNGALEWMEEQILESAGIKKTPEESLLNLRDFNLFREFDDEGLKGLASCVREISVGPGQKVFNRGDKGDELFLIRRGSIRILLPLEGGKRHHIADIARGDFFGELSFLDNRDRSAEAEAKEATDLFVISRTQFNENAHASMILGVKIFARLALVIAERLRQTDAELTALEER